MRALGIMTGYPRGNHGRPAISCVLLEGSRASATVVASFDLKTPSDEPMSQLQDLAHALSSKLSGIDVEQAVIRLADRSPTANRSLAPRVRLMIEGALALTCRDKNLDVRARNGRELGLDTSMSKATLLKQGEQIDPARPDAAAAAFSALP